MNEVILIGGMALVTFTIRYSLMALVGKISLPAPVLRALKFVPPAVLTAIIVPAIVYKGDQLALSYTNDYLVAGIVTALVGWRSKNLLLTILVGMGTLFAWRWLLSTHLFG
ncbi:MAG: AzlD domain-containing protein [Chloroflexota bacterium]